MVLFAVVLIVSALLGGFVYGPQARATAASSDDLQDSVKSFTRVLSVVERNYADPVDTDKAIYDGAIPGMLHVLDPHSNFFDPRADALFREEQEGKILRRRNGGGAARQPDRGAIAVRQLACVYAGIRPGDIILKVDGKNCTGLTTTKWPTC